MNRHNASGFWKSKELTVIDFTRLDNRIVNDAYDRLVAYISLYKKAKSITLLTVCGCQPRVGATTTAVNLAVALASAGWKTAVVDADMCKEANAQHTRYEEGPGLSDYLCGRAQMSDLIKKTDTGNLCYLSSGQKESRTVDLLCSQEMETLITFLRGQFDLVLFDVPSINAAIDAGILASKTDSTILVAKQRYTKLKHIQNAKRELEHVGANLLGIVMNQVDKNIYKDYVNYYNYLSKSHFFRK